ncbi:MAG: hypothetical protein QG650_979, partial [Patescibacteria group bacterium]|nr:hypothetical protein [Patescibacteria group bacterium]
MGIFESPSVILGPVGNNRFGQTEGRLPLPLEIPERIFGDFSDIRISDRVAFRETDEKGVVIEAPGLEKFVSTEWNGTPLHVFDNHNYALAFWLEAYAEGRIETGAVLVHVDMHSDLWRNAHSLRLDRVRETGYVEDFVNRMTEVGNYIDPAIRSGLVGEVVKIEGEEELREALRRIRNGDFGTGISEHRESVMGDFGGAVLGMSDIPPKQSDMPRTRSRNQNQVCIRQSLILNLDLDFFAPDLDYVPFPLKKEAILAFAERSDLIT